MIQTRQLPLPHGITLSCRMAGVEGRPVLMFLHGFPEAAFVWDGLLEHFSKPENGGYFCVAPNLRGFEKSSSPTDPAAYRAKHLVQDISALIAQTCRPGQLECLVAHDWGGAVAWALAATMPQLMKKLVIINSPHAGTFLRELQHSPAQQASSAYMNFLIRPDAEVLLAEDDFRRLWEFFTNMGAASGPNAWLTDSVKAQYREVWSAGLTGGCNLYRASPLRPPRPEDPAAAAVTLPREMLTVLLPTLVVWAMDDTALPPALLDGLADYVPNMQLERVKGASHWIVHELPEQVAGYIQRFLATS
ncbi:MAG TPA: alpha/beta hydrolase [Polaromonas sp.]|uniref:alpha/beta fold hydrolase n=1 Tax=Polaromonas sp. TaxID=1869339 RepID=UPI002D4FB6AE|nr:alpha/beta hydrolase [Polaromonas sp.]HYW56073.1 alpha/beta hydrolase [Polaromonas sp.]